ncbi:HORMA-1 domain-containing protein [Nocardia araoensis]|uniref:HORMA-1 domain-containing protein n=1 Tax=Nocardia araoensis TaxID=228600 RepID=UPI0002E5429E|nr:hypothetical protein [Nocardia araoensis]
MTTSTTRSSSFTITDARYVASKLGANLRNLNARYGKPELSMIDQYIEETAQYLKAGYLDTVDFGFKDGDRWILRLRYTAAAGGQLRDEPPGGLPSAVDVAGYSFYSYLKQNEEFSALPSAERDTFKKKLPFQRSGAPEPSATAGSYGSSSQYSRNGVGLNRYIYCAI